MKMPGTRSSNCLMPAPQCESDRCISGWLGKGDLESPPRSGESNITFHRMVEDGYEEAG